MKLKNFPGILMLAAILFISGCGSKEEAKPETPAAQETAATGTIKKTLDLSSTGSLKGRVLFEGDAPAPKKIPVQGNPECAVLHPGGAVVSEEMLVQNGGLQNVFVYVKEGLEAYSFDTPKEPVTIINSKCVYSPHVMGVQTNQELIFMNQDATLHNIHAYPKLNKPFNLGLPIVGMKQTKKFTQTEVMIPVKCDVHPWMQGYIGVLDHPYFTVTDAEGNFELKNLPPGEYTIEAWHEKLGVQSQKIKIEPQQAQTAEFKFSAAG